MSQFILATGGYDNQIRLFDATDASKLGKIHFHENCVLNLAFSNGPHPVYADSDPLYLAAAASGRISVYDVKEALGASQAPTNTCLQEPLFSFDGHTDTITALGFDPSSPEPRFVYSAGEDGTLQVWDPQLGPAEADPEPVPAPIFDPDVAPDPYQPPPVPASAAPGGPRPLVTETLARFVNHDPIYAAVYHVHRDKRLFYTADKRGRIRVWDYASGDLICCARPHAVYIDEYDDDVKETAAVNAGLESWARDPADMPPVPMSYGGSVGSEIPAIPAPVKESQAYACGNIDRRGVMLQTLELYTSTQGEDSLVAADTRGGVFVYRVDEILRDSHAPPYAKWSVLDRAYVSGTARVYTTRTRVSANGQVLCCTLSSGEIKVYDLRDIDTYAAAAAAATAAAPAPTPVANSIAAARAARDAVRRVDQRQPLLRERFIAHSRWVWDALFVATDVGDADREHYFFSCGSDMQLTLWLLHKENPRPRLAPAGTAYPVHDKPIVCMALKEHLTLAPEEA